MAAPSKLLRPSGEWVKTDRRYAILLARLARNNDIVAVRVPTRSREGARDLVRSRADARGDLMTARHRLSKMLLRRGIVYDGARTWTRIHDAWLRRVRRDHVIGMGPSALAAFDDAYDTVVHTTARRDRLDEAIAGLYHDGELAPTARRLACLRGVSALTAVSLAVEIGDWSRFKGSTIASYFYLGLPSEHFSGTSRSQGLITKTGNTHARRLLIEAAWHHAPAYRPSKAIRVLGPGPRTGRGTGRCRQPPPARPLPGPDRPRQEARRGRHHHRPRERRLAAVPGNHGRLGPARPPRPERLNQVRRNHDLTHQTRSPACRGHTGRSVQGAHAHQLWAPRGDARAQTSRAPRRRMVMRQPDPRISD